MADERLSPIQKAQRQASELAELRRETARPTAGQVVEALLPLYAVASGTDADTLETHINLIAGDGYELVPGSVAMRAGTIIAIMILSPFEEEELPQPAPAPAPVQRAPAGTGAAAVADTAAAPS